MIQIKTNPAFNGDAKLKTRLIERMNANQLANTLFEPAPLKPVSVNAVLEQLGYNLSYEEIGIPPMLLHLGAYTGRCRSKNDVELGLADFLSAIRVSADLSKIVDQYTHWLLLENEEAAAEPSIIEAAALFARKIADDGSSFGAWNIVLKAIDQRMETAKTDRKRKLYDILSIAHYHVYDNTLIAPFFDRIDYNRTLVDRDDRGEPDFDRMRLDETDLYRISLDLGKSNPDLRFGMNYHIPHKKQVEKLIELVSNAPFKSWTNPLTEHSKSEPNSHRLKPPAKTRARKRNGLKAGVES